MAALTSTILRAAPALAALEPSWWALWRAVPGATPFTAPAWLRPWWGAFHPGPLRTVAVHRGEALVALAPLYLEEASGRLLPLGISLSDHLDLLVHPGEPEAGARLLAALDAEPGWGALSLEELEPGAAALAIPAPPGWAETTEDAGPCPVLALPASLSDAAALVPSRQRRKLAMARNRAAKGGVAYAAAAPGQEGAFLDALARLHGARWAGRGEPGGVLADPRAGAFLAAALPRLAAAGLARPLTVSLGGEVAGAMLALAHGGRWFGYMTGFDPARAYESPGTLLLAAAIEAAAAEGARELDLLRGDEAYKYAWGAVDRRNLRRVLRRKR